MIQITVSTLTLIIGFISIGGTIFAIFSYFRNPQVALEKRVAVLEGCQKDNEKSLLQIQTTHMENNGAMQKELKELTTAVTDLGKTVVRLSTIIDERIPKGMPALTPAGT